MISSGMMIDLELFLKRVTDLDDSQFARIKAAYDSPGRYYHHFRHALLVSAQVLYVHAKNPFVDPVAVFIAALYHDAIFALGSKGSEERSVELMKDHLAGRDGLSLDYVGHLIMLTARHWKHEPGELTDDDAKFLDCDLTGFSYDYDDFHAENLLIDKEADHIGMPDDFVKEQRARFFEGLLEREHIFNSPAAQKLYDKKAKNNIKRIIKDRYAT